MSILDDLKHWEEQTSGCQSKKPVENTVRIVEIPNKLIFQPIDDGWMAQGIYSKFYIYMHNSRYSVSRQSDKSDKPSDYPFHLIEDAMEYANIMNTADISVIYKNSINMRYNSNCPLCED